MRFPNSISYQCSQLNCLSAVGVIGAATLTRNVIQEANYQQRNWSNPDYVIEHYDQN